MTRQVELLHDVLQEAGVEIGTQIEREVWDELIIVAFDGAHPATIRNYTKAGEAKILWKTIEGHGKRGRGSVEIIDPRPFLDAEQGPTEDDVYGQEYGGRDSDLDAVDAAA